MNHPSIYRAKYTVAYQNLFDPDSYIHQGNRYDCSSFASRAKAQAVLRQVEDRAELSHPS